MRNIVDASKLDLKSTIVNIRRVAKTVKGGRNMRFSVTVVVGDGNGYVGVGLGKSQEIPEAVRRCKEEFNICSDSRNNSTSQKLRRFRSRQSTHHAGCTRYRSYRRFICSYSS